MPRRYIPFALALPVMLLLAGCLFEATIDAKGAGTMTVSQRLNTKAQLASARKNLESPHVTITSATVDEDRHATFELKFADITKLSTTNYFRNATITLADGPDGTKVLTAKQTNRKPTKLPDEMVAYFGKDLKIILHLPGEIVKSNAAETKNKTATWVHPLNDLFGASELTWNVTFKAPADKAATGKGTGAKEKAPDNAKSKKPGTEQAQEPGPTKNAGK